VALLEGVKFLRTKNQKKEKKRKELIHFIDSNPDFVWKKMKGATTSKNMHVNMSLKTVFQSFQLTLILKRF
jgi:hypothetical protein